MQENAREDASSPIATEKRIEHRTEGALAETAGELVIPLAAEEVRVRTEEIVRGVVRVHKRVETHEETIDATLTSEDVTVERVPIHALVEGDAPQMREEDGVIVIPVLEEVLVVEKRLLLREEVRLTRRTTTASHPQTVTLRRETAEIARTPPLDGSPSAGQS